MTHLAPGRNRGESRAKRGAQRRKRARSLPEPSRADQLSRCRPAACRCGSSAAASLAAWSRPQQWTVTVIGEHEPAMRPGACDRRYADRRRRCGVRVVAEPDAGPAAFDVVVDRAWRRSRWPAGRWASRPVRVGRKRDDGGHGDRRHGDRAAASPRPRSARSAAAPSAGAKRRLALGSASSARVRSTP